MLSSGENQPFLEEHGENSKKKPSSFDRNPRASWHEPNVKHTRLRWLTTHALVCIFTSVFWGALLLSNVTSQLSPHNHVSAHHHDGLENDLSTNFTNNARLITCGHSTPEAKSLGCKYDILSNHWVPGVCMDEDAVADYQRDGSWYGFADENRTELLDYGSMGDYPVYYTSMRDHIVHCAVLWKKQFAAFYMERGSIDTIIGSYEHTMHCAQFLVDMTEDGPDYWNMPIEVEVAWAGCWIRD